MRVITGMWREHDNKVRPHSAPGVSPTRTRGDHPKVAERICFAASRDRLGFRCRFELTSNMDRSSQAVRV